ncbi:hypothetical protein FH039_09550 [Thermococcus indicus]|uniref:Uncharacterized protein n=1 Tax=Thermococcus indicus TaxID=2586643 RepID=A0A4Y5SN81_9EURY|nr:hypothetical protein [Thermococcus indicus]QDA31794.1 hypothetical protein FH039_09550 [Thermococcus indicus]
MPWKFFKLYPWVYYCKGTNGATLYDWLNGKILSLNNEQAKVLEKLINGVFEEDILKQDNILAKLRDFGFVSSDNIYIDNLTLGSKLQKVMQFINTFHVQRLDLVLNTPCDRYESCPIRNSMVVSHACESCLGCAKKDMPDRNINPKKLAELLNVFRPQVVTLSGGELFSDVPLVNNVLSLLLESKYPDIAVLIMPLHSIVKFRSEVAKHTSMFLERGKKLALTVVLTKHEFEGIPKILGMMKELNITLTFVAYMNLDKPPAEIPELNSLQKTVTIVSAFYSLSGRNVLENLEKFLNMQYVNPYIVNSPAIENLINAIEYGYASCLYGNLMIDLPNGIITPCKGYCLLNYIQKELNRKALQKVMLLWEDPCRDCSLKGACTICRSIVESINITPHSCPIWEKPWRFKK